MVLFGLLCLQVDLPDEVYSIAVVVHHALRLREGWEGVWVVEMRLDALREGWGWRLREEKMASEPVLDCGRRDHSIEDLGERLGLIRIVCGCFGSLRTYLEEPWLVVYRFAMMLLQEQGSTQQGLI